MAHVEKTDEKVQGQGQEVRVRETTVVLDEQILDPNDPLAVQVPPEGTTVNDPNPLAEALQEDVPLGGGGDRPLADVKQPEIRSQSTVVGDVPAGPEESRDPAAEAEVVRETSKREAKRDK